MGYAVAIGAAALIMGGSLLLVSLLLRLVPYLVVGVGLPWLIWFWIRQQGRYRRLGPERYRRLMELRHQRRERRVRRLKELVHRVEAAQRRNRAEARRNPPTH